MKNENPSLKKRVKIETGWEEQLQEEFTKPYFHALIAFVRKAYATRAIYPAPGHIFRAFEATPWSSVRVVIIGQDPYHHPGQADGLAFSVPKGIKLPPSLRNILEEKITDVGGSFSSSGDLSHWASQGVLLLNSVLTVERQSPASHQGKGWECFTNRVIALLSEKKEEIVFILWGKYAAQKSRYIDRKRHHILISSHPSPFSVNRGFKGSQPFSETNQYLIKKGSSPILW